MFRSQIITRPGAIRTSGFVVPAVSNSQHAVPPSLSRNVSMWQGTEQKAQGTFLQGAPLQAPPKPIGLLCVQDKPLVNTGASPGMVSELAHLLQMPAKMAESLLSKNPTLQSVTVMQVSSCLDSLVSDLGITAKQARFMMSKKPVLLLQTPVPQLKQQLRLLAHLNNLNAKLTLKWAIITPSVLSRDAALLTQRISRLGLVLSAPPRIIVRMMIACPHYLTDRYALLSRRLDALARSLQRTRHIACRVAQRCPSILFLSPRIVQNKIAALGAVLDRPRRHVLTLIVKCPKLLRSGTDKLRETYEGLRPLLGSTQDFVFAMACHDPRVLRLSLVPLRQRLQRLRHAVNAIPEWAEQWRRTKPPQRQELLDVRFSSLERLEYLVASRQTANTSLTETLLCKRRIFLAKYPSIEHWEIQTGRRPAPVSVSEPLITPPALPLFSSISSISSPRTAQSQQLPLHMQTPPSDLSQRAVHTQPPPPSLPSSPRTTQRGSSLLGLGLHTQPASLQGKAVQLQSEGSVPETQVASGSNTNQTSPWEPSRQNVCHPQQTPLARRHQHQQEQQQQQQYRPQEQQHSFSPHQAQTQHTHPDQQPQPSPRLRWNVPRSKQPHTHPHQQQRQRSVYAQQQPSEKVQLKREAMLLQAQLAIWQQSSQGRKDKPITPTPVAPSKLRVDVHVLTTTVHPNQPQQQQRQQPHVHLHASTHQAGGIYVSRSMHDGVCDSSNSDGRGLPAHTSSTAAHPPDSSPVMTSLTNSTSSPTASLASAPHPATSSSTTTTSSSSTKLPTTTPARSVFPQLLNPVSPAQMNLNPHPASPRKSEHSEARSSCSSSSNSNSSSSGSSSSSSSTFSSCGGGINHTPDDIAASAGSAAPVMEKASPSVSSRGRTNRERRSRKPGLTGDTNVTTPVLSRAAAAGQDAAVKGITDHRTLALNGNGGSHLSPSLPSSARPNPHENDPLLASTSVLAQRVQPANPLSHTPRNSQSAQCLSSSGALLHPQQHAENGPSLVPLIEVRLSTCHTGAAGDAAMSAGHTEAAVGVAGHAGGYSSVEVGTAGQSSLPQALNATHKWNRQDSIATRKLPKQRHATSQRASVERLQAVFDFAPESSAKVLQAGQDSDVPSHVLV